MCADDFPGRDALDSSRLLNLATKLLRTTLTNRLAPYGLTSAQWAVLALIERLEAGGGSAGCAPAGRGINAATLGSHLQIDRTTMSGIVRRLERDGWISVGEHPTDRRRRAIRITERARSLQPAFKVLVRETVEQAARGFRQDELETLNRLLERVIDNLRPSGTAE